MQADDSLQELWYFYNNTHGCIPQFQEEGAVDISAYVTNPMDKRLMNALTEKLQTEPIDKITMTDVLEEAHVSRSTFYRHYRDKYDLLNKNYQILLDSTLFRMKEGVSYKTVFYQIYTVISKNPAVFKSALFSEDHNSLFNYIYSQAYIAFSEILEEHGLDLSDPYNDMLLRGYLMGALEVVSMWARDGMKESLDLIFKLTLQLMPEEIKSCVTLYYM